MHLETYWNTIRDDAFYLCDMVDRLDPNEVNFLVQSVMVFEDLTNHNRDSAVRFLNFRLGVIHKPQHEQTSIDWVGLELAAVRRFPVLTIFVSHEILIP